MSLHEHRPRPQGGVGILPALFLVLALAGCVSDDDGEEGIQVEVIVTYDQNEGPSGTGVAYRDGAPAVGQLLQSSIKAVAGTTYEWRDGEGCTPGQYDGDSATVRPPDCSKVEDVQQYRLPAPGQDWSSAYHPIGTDGSVTLLAPGSLQLRFFFGTWAVDDRLEEHRIGTPCQGHDNEMLHIRVVDTTGSIHLDPHPHGGADEMIIEGHGTIHVAFFVRCDPGID